MATLDQMHGCVLAELQHAWLEPNGRLHPCELWGHDEFAFSISSNSEMLIKKGWVRLSEGDWQSNIVTQSQLDTIADWYFANTLIDHFDADDYKVI